MDFDINEEKLAEKAPKLVNLGCDFYFKMSRKIVAGSMLKTYDNFTDEIEEPYKTFFKNMIRLNIKTKSSNLKNSIFRCLNEKVDVHFDFIKNFPEKFREQCINPNEINIFLEKKIIEDVELSKLYSNWNEVLSEKENRIIILR